MFKEKFQELLDFGDSLGMADLSTWEDGGKFYIKGMLPYQLDKNLFWDKLKTYDNWENEVSADIEIENVDIFGVYTVKPGDSLSKIAKWLFGDAMKYMDIYNFNTDILKDPNNISVGQKIKLPTPE
jgi:LysM domain